MSFVEANALINQVGFVKPTRFLINFAGPPVLIPPEGNIRLSITCEETQLPGVAVSTNESRIHGPLTKYPYLITYTNELTMTFRVGKDMYEKRLFEEWLDIIVDRKTYDIEYYDKYAFDLEIMQLGNEIESTGDANSDRSIENFFGRITDRFENSVRTNLGLNDFKNSPLIRIGSEKPIYTAKIKGVFPTSVQEIALSQSDANAYERVIVTFSFTEWEPLPEITDEDLAKKAPVSFEDRQNVDRIDAINIIDYGSRAASVFGKLNNGKILPF